MKKIKSFSLVFFTNHALVGYCTEVESHVLTSIPAEDAALCEDFRARLKEFKSALATSVETFNDAIVEADKAADQAWMAINTLLTLNVNHYDPSVCEASQQVFSVFETIPNPTRLPYADEYAKLESLLSLLAELPSETLAVAMVEGWTAELRRRVDAFNELRRTKTQVRSEVETGATKKLRLALCDAYRDMVERLNAMHLIKGAEAYDTISQQLNELIDSNRAVIKARRTLRKSGSDANLLPDEAEGLS